MGSDIAFPGGFTTSCKLRSFASSSVLRLSRLAPKPRHRTRPSDWPTFASKELVCCDYDVMSRLPRFLKPLTAGLTVTLLQLAMTLGLLAPEEPISHGYFAMPFKLTLPLPCSSPLSWLRGVSGAISSCFASGGMFRQRSRFAARY